MNRTAAVLKILDGEHQERTHAEARAGIHWNAAQVRATIAEMEKKTKSLAARKLLATQAIARGNVTTEGREIWREYAATFN